MYPTPLDLGMMDRPGKTNTSQLGASPTAPPGAARSDSSRLAGKLVLLFGSLMVSLLLAEIGLRIFYRDTLAEPTDVRNLGYRYDKELGWFPIANNRQLFKASRVITAAHNSDGFRGPELAKNNKPRLVFLGDSLVWGYDVEASERFTEKLQAKHPEWAIYNLGIAGYGTDQEYLLLQKYFDEYRPQAVFLVICGDNDNDDNASNFRYGYYKPFFTLKDGGLKLHGVPVPRSDRFFLAEHRLLCRPYLVRLLVAAYFKLSSPRPMKNPDPPTGVLLLELRKYVVSRGAWFGVGLQHPHAQLEKFLTDFKIPYVDLETTNPADRYAAFGSHWTPKGHTIVADKIDQFLKGQHAGRH
jgi:hypothetical protein